MACLDGRYNFCFLESATERYSVVRSVDGVYLQKSTLNDPLDTSIIV